MKGRSYPFKGIIAYPPTGVKARFTIFWFLLSFRYFGRKCEVYVWIVYAVILYVYSFLCWCVGAVLRSPLRPSAERWDTSPAGGGKCTGVNRGKVCGKAKQKKLHLTTKFPSVHRRALGSPRGGAGAKRLRGQQKKRPFPDALHTCIIFAKMNIPAACKKTAVPAGTAAAACRRARSVFGFTRGSRSRCRGPRSSWRRRSS